MTDKPVPQLEILEWDGEYSIAGWGLYDPFEWAVAVDAWLDEEAVDWHVEEEVWRGQWQSCQTCAEEENYHTIWHADAYGDYCKIVETRDVTTTRVFECPGDCDDHELPAPNDAGVA